MAESNGSGFMGVLLGALLVIVIGGAALYGTGVIGGANKTSTVKIELPKPASAN